VKKELMAIEKIEILRLPVSHNQRKVILVKTTSKRTPFAPQKKMKKNTSKKSSGGLELNFNRVKI